MVDDLLAINQCGPKSMKMNTIINSKIELKKLEFHLPEASKVGKCNFMHIGKPSESCPGMKVHGQSAIEVKEAMYLGDIIRSDGKNISNVKSRVQKGIGIAAEIISLLKSISFGKRHFEIAVILREARLINCILTNAEVWYSLGNTEIANHEKVDTMFLRKVLSVPPSVSKESLYLELGLIPISVIIKSRRVMYLHYLANLQKDEMLYKVFIAQWQYPGKDDWTEIVRADLLDLGLTLKLDYLRGISKNSFKRSVKVKSRQFALDYLLKVKEKHTKMKDLNYSELKMQNYLKDPKISVEEAQNIFRFRTRSANFKENMKAKYAEILCPLCENQPDSQSHSFECSIVKEKIKISGNYEDIFNEIIPYDVSKSLMEIRKLRENVMLSQVDPRASFDAAE